MRPVYRCEESADDAATDDSLPEPCSRPAATVFQSLTVSAARAFVARRAQEAGMDPARTNDLVLAVNEIATNSVRHAEGWGTLRIWREGDRLVCEVADRGGIEGGLPVPSRPMGDRVSGYGLWLAERLCERVEVRSAQGGTVIRLHARLRDALKAV